MWIFLSHKLSTATPSYGNGPGMKIGEYKSIRKGDSSNSFIIELYNHLGTHVDAPYHFDPAGRRIADFTPDELIFTKPLLIDIPKGVGEPITGEELEAEEERIGRADILLIRTGFQRMRIENPELFANKGPYLSVDAASLIRERFNNLRALGVDAISISSPSNREEGREAHRKLLVGRDFLIIEDMDLMNKPTNIKKIILSPIMFSEVDSSPCTVWAEV